MKNRLFYKSVTGSPQDLSLYMPAGALDLDAALAVYQNGYIARLTETLGDTFESVWSVLGDEDFFQICRQFISSHPSQNYNLSNYSVKFVDFLISHPASEEFPFLPDLAHLGWLHKEVFHRPHQEGLNSEALMKLLEQDKARVFLIETFELLRSEYCLFDIWKALKDQSDPPTPWRESQCLVLYKSEQQVFVKQVTERQFEALEKIQLGIPLIEALEELEEFEISDLFQFLAKNKICDVF